MSSVDELVSALRTGYDFVRNRITGSFSGTFDLSQWQWIRLALVVIGYIALRPFIVKLGSYIGEKEMAKRERKENERKDKERRERKAQAKIAANTLRTGQTGQVLGEVDSEEEEIVEGINIRFTGVKKTVAGKKNIDKYRGLSESRRKILEGMESDEDVEDLITGRSDM